MRALLAALAIFGVACCATLHGAEHAPSNDRTILGAGDSLGRAPGVTGDHAWIVLRAAPSIASEPAHAILLHVPPAGDSQTGVRSARVTRTLDAWPDAVAGSYARVSMAFVDRPAAPVNFAPPPARPTRIASLHAVRQGDRWVSLPSHRMDPRPGLEAGVEVIALAESGVGLAALVHPSASRRPRLMLLRGAKWEELALPDGVHDRHEHLILAPHKRGVVIGSRSQSGELDMWIAWIDPGEDEPYLYGLEDHELPVGPPAPKPRTQVQWSDWNSPLDAGAGASAIASVADHIVLASHQDGRLCLYATGAAQMPSWRKLTELALTSQQFCLLPQAGCERVMVLWIESDEVRNIRSSLPSLRFVDVSVATGALLGQGELRISGPATRGDILGMILLLAWIIGLVVLVVLKPEDADALILPEGASLAEPVRRMIAGTIDTLLILVCAAFVIGKRPVDVLTTSAATLLTTGDGQVLLAVTLALGVCVSSFMEWAFGRTVGKMLTGCAVADLSRAVPPGRAFRRISLARAILRNLIKWCLPPAGLIGVLGAGVRHRGDEYTRAGVIEFGRTRDLDAQDDE